MHGSKRARVARVCIILKYLPVLKKGVPLPCRLSPLIPPSCVRVWRSVAIRHSPCHPQVFFRVVCKTHLNRDRQKEFLFKLPSDQRKDFMKMHMNEKESKRGKKMFADKS